jgi:hypothetical protein
MAITPSLNASSLDVVITYTVSGNQPGWPQLRIRFETALCRRPTSRMMDVLRTAVSKLKRIHQWNTVRSVAKPNEPVEKVVVGPVDGLEQDQKT